MKASGDRSAGQGDRLRRTGPASRGQGLVEFALVFPFLCLLVLGIFDFGLFIVSASSMSTANRDAARYAASSGTTGEGIAHYQDCETIRNMANVISQFTHPDVVIEYDPDGPGDAAPYEYCQVGMESDPIEAELGGRIIVTSTFNYSSITGQIFYELPPIPLSARTARTVVKEIPIK
jgi:hypothetical protein